MILDKKKIEIENPDSVLDIHTAGSGHYLNWKRYISVAGKKVLNMGNVCSSCPFFFKRLKEKKLSISPEDIIEKLNHGITKLEPELINSLQKIFPSGAYFVLLSQINPKLVHPNDDNDYFTREARVCYPPGEQPPPSPGVEYYRSNSQRLDKYEYFFEFLIPMLSKNKLDKQRIQEYQHKFELGIKPTAVSLSTLEQTASDPPNDMVPPMESNDYGHTCLVHYLIDGHHKTYAAATKGMPITLISFLAINHGVLHERSDYDTTDALIQKISLLDKGGIS